jgi:hypothetical protein
VGLLGEVLGEVLEVLGEASGQVRWGGRETRAGGEAWGVDGRIGDVVGGGKIERDHEIVCLGPLEWECQPAWVAWLLRPWGWVAWEVREVLWAGHLRWGWGAAAQEKLFCLCHHT